jgi:hypothetical protein
MPVCSLYGGRFGLKRRFAWIRKSDPPWTRGSAWKWELISRRCGRKARTKALHGSRTSSSYRARFASNHAFSLFSLRSRKKSKSAGEKGEGERADREGDEGLMVVPVGGRQGSRTPCTEAGGV